MFGAFRQFIPWFIATLVSLLLILANQNPQIESIRNGFNDLVILGSSPLSSLLKAPHIWRENQMLRRKLADLTLELARLQRNNVEAPRLRALLGFAESSRYSLVAAEVIGLNPDQSVRGMLINRGSSDGIACNQAAMVPEGIVGRVYRVSVNSAAIQLLTDPNLGVAARLKQARENGIIRAGRGQGLQLDGVPVTAVVDVGDTVLSSGLGGIFPPDILIGVVSQVKPDPEGWLWDIEVTTEVDFGKIEELFVIQGLPVVP
jgi:rod shape-determining protein MreC